MKKSSKGKKPQLSAGELGVCFRVREARELLGLTQVTFACEVGILPGTLSSYELGAAPIKFDLGLRICRQWVISEEWLATGEFEIARSVQKSKNISDIDLPSGSTVLMDIFFRQCMDLATHPAANSIFRGTSFATAWPMLAAAFQERMGNSFNVPAIEWGTNEVELAKRILIVQIERGILLARHSAIRGNRAQEITAQHFLKMSFACNHLLSKLIDGVGISHEEWKALEWLRNQLVEPPADGLEFRRKLVDVRSSGLIPEVKISEKWRA